MKAKKHSSKSKKAKRSSSKSYLYSALGVVGVIAVFGLTQTLVQAASLQFDSSKNLARASVLGEDEASEQEKQQEEAEKKAQEQQKEAAKNAEEAQKETTKSSNSGSGSTSKTQSEGSKIETEIETASGQKIKTKVENDGTTKVEIEHGELTVKYIVKDGQVIKKVEDESGNEVELEDSDLDEIENELENDLGDDDIEIATNSGRPAIIKNKVAALTDFPLSIDLGTNQLIITTPKGQKIVTVLPDQAVEALLATGFLNTVNSVQSSDESVTSATGSVDNVVELKVRNGEPVYEIEGTKTFRLFAAIPIEQPVKAIVSAETGEVVAKQQSFVTNVIDFLSP